MDIRHLLTGVNWSSQTMLFSLSTHSQLQAACMLCIFYEFLLHCVVCFFLGTKENLSVTKTLEEMWVSVESDLEKHSVTLLRWIIYFAESFIHHSFSVVSCGGTICCLLCVSGFSYGAGLLWVTSGLRGKCGMCLGSVGGWYLLSVFSSLT